MLNLDDISDIHYHVRDIKLIFQFYIFVPLQIYTQITLAQKDSMTPVEQNVDKMLLLLATVYESARLLPAGPLLQRCSLDHGNVLTSLVQA